MFPPSRIVCLTEETVETLYLLGEQDRIVGISGYVVRPPEARREKPRVGAFTAANIDKILALRPDLVLTFSDLQAGKAGGTTAQGIFVKSTTGGTSGVIMHYVDPTGTTIFALLPDGSILLRPLDAPPTGTRAGLKLCNVGGILGVVDAAGTFTPLT